MQVFKARTVNVRLSLRIRDLGCRGRHRTEIREAWNLLHAYQDKAPPGEGFGVRSVASSSWWACPGHPRCNGGGRMAGTVARP
jgi:hypothetical protein